MSRQYPERPILGVGAIIREGGRIVLIERGHEPLKGEWSLPGGVVEVGETLKAAIRREVREETGLEIEPLSVVEIFERVMRDAEGRAEYHYVLVDYLCRAIGGELRAGDDVSAAIWVTPAELSNYRITEGTVAVIEKALRTSLP
ncbi:MAG TPA: NUDIX hydrolase [Bryobacteraceae bacterium]|nr:NUDIX hydrolase [Bryobacteraceae bacterium]